MLMVDFCTSTAWVGNFIIGANGSDKQMLCGSCIARAAPTISAVNRIQKECVCHSSYKAVFMVWNFEKKENVVQYSGCLTCFLV